MGYNLVNKEDVMGVITHLLTIDPNFHGTSPSTKTQPTNHVRLEPARASQNDLKAKSARKFVLVVDFVLH